MNIKELDHRNVWHPYTQHKLGHKNFVIERAKGVYLYDAEGNAFIDAIASWWVNIHGHSHPLIGEAISSQFKKLDQIIFAGFTHEPAVTLADSLLKLLPEGQDKVFYSDNGSTAVEVALKMAFQFWGLKGQARKKVIALDGAFHGDTFGAMSVGERGLFNKHFEELLFDVEFLPTPWDHSKEDILGTMQGILERHSNNIASFIYEPLVMGAAGMKMYSPELLDELIHMCKKAHVLCIADEVMTGFGRTGTLFASEQMENKPDMVCLSKGLTGGVLPLGVTTCTKDIFEAFLSNDKAKTFFHGHSFTANAITCAVALASLKLFEKENTLGRVKEIENKHKEFIDELSKYEHVSSLRYKGAILAFELSSEGSNDYFDAKRDELYSFFIGKGILLRPLGNTLYILPPFCITDDELKLIYDAILDYLSKNNV